MLLVYRAKLVPVKFVSVNPANGSLILPDDILTVTFDGERV